MQPKGSQPNGSEGGLVCRHVSKTYNEMTVLSDLSLEVRPGEVLALLGGNGAGKSTFVKIVSGVVAPDPGASIRVDERDWNHGLSTHQARTAGVRVVHQDAPLIAGLPLVDSIALNCGYDTGFLSPIPWRRVRRKVSELLDNWGVNVDPKEFAGALSPAERALVSLGMALNTDEGQARILILDELTASLPRQDLDVVSQPVLRAAHGGCAVVVVTHRLEEIDKLADRVVVLRDGVMVDSALSKDRSLGELAGTISGAVLSEESDRPLGIRDDPTAPRSKSVANGSGRFTVGAGSPNLSRNGFRFSASHISGDGLIDLSLEVRGGEILGITGDAGSGIRQVGPILGGGHRDGGSLMVDDKEIKSGAIRAAIRNGICYVPGDRWRFGGIRAMNLMDNINMPRYGEFWHRRRSELKEVARLLGVLDVHPADWFRALGSLSGGNQQKAIFAKWTGMGPTALVAESPTIGVDVGARRRIYSLLRATAASGAAICIVSEDLMDIASVCDRVCVLTAGEVSREVAPHDVAWEQLASDLYDQPGLPTVERSGI